MVEYPYSEEMQVVQRAIAQLRLEKDQNLIVYLEAEQKAASTGLEGLAITLGIFQEILDTRMILPETREALLLGIRAIRGVFSAR